MNNLSFPVSSLLSIAFLFFLYPPHFSLRTDFSHASRRRVSLHKIAPGAKKTKSGGGILDVDIFYLNISIIPESLYRFFFLGCCFLHRDFSHVLGFFAFSVFVRCMIIYSRSIFCFHFFFLFLLKKHE